MIRDLKYNLSSQEVATHTTSSPMSADPYAFWLTHIAQFWGAYSFALQAMLTIPTPIFCESLDPCSCTGGGFELYEPICAAAAAAREAIKTNTTTNTTLKTSNMNITRLQSEYVSLFDFLGNDTATVLVSVGVVVIIGVTFALLRLLMGLQRANEGKAKAQREQEETEQQRLELLEQNKRIEEQNKHIQDQLMLTQLNTKQVAIVEANSSDFDKQVPALFQLNWRDLLFEGRLGSGSFGDCYRGRCVYTFCAIVPCTTLANICELNPPLFFL